MPFIQKADSHNVQLIFLTTSYSNTLLTNSPIEESEQVILSTPNHSLLLGAGISNVNVMHIPYLAKPVRPSVKTALYCVSTGSSKLTLW